MDDGLHAQICMYGLFMFMLDLSISIFSHRKLGVLILWLSHISKITLFGGCSRAGYFLFFSNYPGWIPWMNVLLCLSDCLEDPVHLQFLGIS